MEQKSQILTSIENLRSTGIKDVDGNMIYEGDTVAILNTADNNAIAEGEIVFCAGAYGIRTTEVIDYNFLVSELKIQSISLGVIILYRSGN